MKLTTGIYTATYANGAWTYTLGTQPEAPASPEGVAAQLRAGIQSGLPISVDRPDAAGITALARAIIAEAGKPAVDLLRSLRH